MVRYSCFFFLSQNAAVTIVTGDLHRGFECTLFAKAVKSFRDGGSAVL